MNKRVGAGLFIVTLTASGLAFSDCPETMPEKLLVDCIINENAGTAFPPGDYADMQLYKEWLKTQQSATIQLSKKSSNTKQITN